MIISASLEEQDAVASRPNISSWENEPPTFRRFGLSFFIPALPLLPLSNNNDIMILMSLQ